MKKLFLTIAIIAAAFTVQAQDQGDGFIITTGDAVPQFTVTMTDGSTIDMADLKGKVVLISLWASWCPPCRDELEEINEVLLGKYPEDKFVFLPINFGESQEKAAAYLADKGYVFSSGVDSDAKIFGRFSSVGSIPRSILINPDGTVAHTQVGFGKGMITESVIPGIDRIIE